MAHIKWNREMEIDLPDIDKQHRQIVDYINALDDAILTSNKDDTLAVMEGLLNYTVTHFEYEEELQEKAGYPYLKAHRRIHEIFMKKIAAFRERSNSGEDVAPELLELLQGWLVSHIKSEDRDYVDYVKKLIVSA